MCDTSIALATGFIWSLTQQVHCVKEEEKNLKLQNSRSGCVYTWGTREINKYTMCLDPFRTAIPFRGQITQFPSSLPPKRDCGPNEGNVGLGVGSLASRGRLTRITGGHI